MGPVDRPISVVSIESTFDFFRGEKELGWRLERKVLRRRLKCVEFATPGFFRT